MHLHDVVMLSEDVGDLPDARLELLDLATSLHHSALQQLPRRRLHPDADSIRGIKPQVREATMSSERQIRHGAHCERARERSSEVATR